MACWGSRCSRRRCASSWGELGRGDEIPATLAELRAALDQAVEELRAIMAELQAGEMPLDAATQRADVNPSSAANLVVADPISAREERQPRTSAEQRQLPTRGSIRGARILVVDDEPGLAAVISQLLERSGATVSVAHGGVAALAAVQAPETSFDVVVTDLDMPEVDGWMLAAAVKGRSPSTGVVVLTGWAADMRPDDFTRRGVNRVLAKPCGRAELEAAIADLL
ncbi:MAG TPA: response regulator [Chloroflexota bacterium]